MSESVITNGEMVEIQLRKWVSKRRVANVIIRPTYSHPDVPKGELPIAEVVNRSSQGVFFTATGFTIPGRGFVRYANVATATWISSRPDRISRKREDFDHIEFSFFDGTSASLVDLGQAVFPVLRFFNWMVEQRKPH